MSQSPKTMKPFSKKKTHLLDQLRRKRGTRNLAKRFLIVCEDNKSAPHYFEALKKHFNLTAASIEVVGSGGYSQTMQVVKRAVEIKKNAARDDNGTVQFEQVWCVIDGDYRDKIPTARSCAKANDIELAISTLCFEHWVMLHFEEWDKSSLKCDAIVSALKRKHLPQYAKGKCDFREIVKSVRTACERAKKLRRLGELPEVQNPCSEVCKLVNAILAEVVEGSS